MKKKKKQEIYPPTSDNIISNNVSKLRSMSESDIKIDNNISNISNIMQKTLHLSNNNNNNNEDDSPRSFNSNDNELKLSSGVSTTKLHELCNHGNPSIEMIRIYLSTYPWSVKQKDTNGDLPLHVALKRDDPAALLICELLNKYPDGAKIKDCDGNLPLFLACRKQKVTTGIIKALLQAYPGAAMTKSFGSLALHHLCQNGNATPDAIRLLITANHSAVYTPNGFGNIPLHFICASSKPQVEATRILMNNYPTGITHLNKMNETPIARALKKNNSDEMKERVRLLLRLADRNSLNEEQIELLRELNWGARKAVILLCAHFCKLNDPRDRGLLHYYLACNGVFRHIINFL